MATNNLVPFCQCSECKIRRIMEEPYAQSIPMTKSDIGDVMLFGSSMRKVTMNPDGTAMVERIAPSNAEYEDTRRKAMKMLGISDEERVDLNEASILKAAEEIQKIAAERGTKIAIKPTRANFHKNLHAGDCGISNLFSEPVCNCPARVAKFLDELDHCWAPIDFTNSQIFVRCNGQGGFDFDRSDATGKRTPRTTQYSSVSRKEMFDLLIEVQEIDRRWTLGRAAGTDPGRDGKGGCETEHRAMMAEAQAAAMKQDRVLFGFDPARGEDLSAVIVASSGLLGQTVVTKQAFRTVDPPEFRSDGTVVLTGLDANGKHITEILHFDGNPPPCPACDVLKHIPGASPCKKHDMVDDGCDGNGVAHARSLAPKRNLKVSVFSDGVSLNATSHPGRQEQLAMRRERLNLDDAKANHDWPDGRNEIVCTRCDLTRFEWIDRGTPKCTPIDRKPGLDLARVFAVPHALDGDLADRLTPARRAGMER